MFRVPPPTIHHARCLCRRPHTTIVPASIHLHPERSETPSFGILLTDGNAPLFRYSRNGCLMYVPRPICKLICRMFLPPVEMKSIATYGLVIVWIVQKRQFGMSEALDRLILCRKRRDRLPIDSLIQASMTKFLLQYVVLRVGKR